MCIFTPAEKGYLQSQRLGRLATVGSDGHPHVVPVAFRYNSDFDTIEIGGHDFAKRKKFRDIQHNPWVAFVIDDIPSINPWIVWGIEIRGEAVVLETGGTEIVPNFSPEMIRIKPKRIISWGIEGERSPSNARSIE
jgi:pyridoxamine 5'-phosphate oxidase family protein